jgi:hypothetical protein
MIMPSRSKECAAVSHAPVLTAQLLSRLHQLNFDYLQLLLDTQLSEPCAHGEGLPLILRHALRELGAPGLQLIAAAPYALYTLGFEDQELWCAMLGDESAPALQVADSGSGGCRVLRHAALCEALIFFAWHVAVAHPLAARVMFGMPAMVREHLQAASFGKLQALMRTCPWLLVPRWIGNPRFWPELVRFAALGEARAIQHVQLLGSQLIASDLKLAECPPAERVRATRSAQLLRWKAQQRSWEAVGG